MEARISVAVRGLSSMIALCESAQAMKSALFAVETSFPPEIRLQPRRAAGEDLEELTRLERSCFEPWRQDSRDVIRGSLASNRQEVWVVPAEENAARLAAALFLRFPARDRMRIYSVSVDAARRGSGLGGRLMEWAWERAGARGIRWVSLEADAASLALVAWYERLGYHKTEFLPDFYDAGRHAWRMVREREAVGAGAH